MLYSNSISVKFEQPGNMYLYHLFLPTYYLLNIHVLTTAEIPDPSKLVEFKACLRKSNGTVYCTDAGSVSYCVHGTDRVHRARELDVTSVLPTYIM